MEVSRESSIQEKKLIKNRSSTAQVFAWDSQTQMVLEDCRILPFKRWLLATLQLKLEPVDTLKSKDYLKVRF